jgi:hypothetical protein
MEKKLDIKKLKQQLELLETELECLGSPLTHIRRVHDIATSIKWLEKHVK